MNRRTVVTTAGVAAAVVATVAVTSVLTQQRSVALPRPQAVTGQDIKALRTAPTTTTTRPVSVQLVAPGPGPHQPLPVVDQQTGAVSPVPPPVDGATYRLPATATFAGCTVTVSDPHPPAGHTQETVSVSTTAGAVVRVRATYPKTVVARSGMADQHGSLTVSLGIASSAVGAPVTVTASATYRNHLGTCQTTFTPA